MILIADCGGSSCKWLVMTDEAEPPASFVSRGHNFAISTQGLFSEKVQPLKNQLEGQTVRELYFFGAGLNSAEKLMSAKNELEIIFPGAEIYVDSDIVLVGLSLAGSNEGICCILGTGSNAIFWKGSGYVKKSPSLGYILGDEASGAFFGKTITRDLAYGLLPDELSETLRHRMGMNVEQIIHETYNSEYPNRFLASVFGTLRDKFEHPYMVELLQKGLELFFALHVDVYSGARKFPLYFSGSVAKGLENQIRRLAGQKGYRIDRIIDRPLDHLDLRDLKTYVNRKRQQN